MDEITAKKLIGQGIVPLLGMRQAITAVECAFKIGQAQNVVCVPPDIKTKVRQGLARNLDEWSATELLRRAGLRVPKNALVDSMDAAVRAAQQINYPVVMKSVSADIVHKTEAGGVALNLGSEQAVSDAAQRLSTLSDRIMVAEMVTDAVAEIIVGVSRDSLFGLYLMIGMGGVTVELIADRKILLLPVSDSAIRNALLSLKLAPLLQGYRGRPLADIEAVVASVSAIARFVEQNSDSIVELEINPLLVRRQGGGAYVADAFLNIVGELPGEK